MGSLGQTARIAGMRMRQLHRKTGLGTLRLRHDITIRGFTLCLETGLW